MWSKPSSCLFFGPSFLLGAFILLFYRTSHFIGRPIWLFGLILSIFFALGIIYLTFKELIDREEKLFLQISQSKKETEEMKGTLEETHFLYREKVEKLETSIQSMEEKQKSDLENKEERIKGLEEIYEKAQSEAKSQKNRTLALQTSLEDALDELRNIRQTQYLQQELGKIFPKDLPMQHRQLRQQFEEKSLIVDQTRRRLFQVEGHLLALKKQMAMEKLEENIEEKALFQSLQKLLEENEQQKEEITLLEKVVTESFAPLKKGKTSKKLENLLEFQFDSHS